MSPFAVYLGISSLCLLHSAVYSKVHRGIVSSQRAWEENGQFVTKFCFHDQKALFRFTSNTTASGKWYFFLDEHWHHAFSEPDCEKKIAMARFKVDVTGMSGSQYVNQWIRPHFWFVIYADPTTCANESPPLNEVIEFKMEFLNPDLLGTANDHFGDDLSGLLPFYCLLALLYTAGTTLYAHRVWITISKGGPMHHVLQMLSMAMGLHFSSAILMLIHLWRYYINGEGIPIFSVSSEVLEMLAQCQMIWMLLGISVGWTVTSSSSHPIRDKRQLLINTTVAAMHLVLVIWEQSYDESHYTYHIHENLPGWLLVLLRVGLAVLIGYNLQNTTREEFSVLKRDFYHSFAIGCYLWFFAFPILMLTAMFFAEYHRQKVVTVGTTMIQTVSMTILSRLFLSRSLYWEVSSLSSTTLPFKRDRSGGGGFMTLLHDH